MNVLTERDRQALLDYLSENATDDVLIRAVEELKEHREYVRNSMISLNKYLGTRPSAAPTPLPPADEPAAAPTIVPDTRKANISPGAPSISKIGSNTKGELLAQLKVKPRSLSELGQKYTEHMKLLWSRGEVKFDGERYYL